MCGRPTGQHCGRSALHPCTAQQAAGVHAALHCSAETLPVPHPPALNCSDELLAGVRLHRIGDYNLGWVEGRVGPPADGSEVRWWQACELSCVLQRATTLTQRWLARSTAHTHDIECGARPSALPPQSQLPQLLPPEGADGGAADGGYGGVFIGDVRLSGGWMGQVMWAVVGHTPLPCPDADVFWVITRLPASNGSAFEVQLAHTPITAAVLPAPQS